MPFLQWTEPLRVHHQLKTKLHKLATGQFYTAFSQSSPQTALTCVTSTRTDWHTGAAASWGFLSDFAVRRYTASVCFFPPTLSLGRVSGQENYVEAADFERIAPNGEQTDKTPFMSGQVSLPSSFLSLSLFSSSLFGFKIGPGLCVFLWYIC